VLACLSFANGGGKQHGITVRDEHRALRLLRQSSSFEGKGAPAELGRYPMYGRERGRSRSRHKCFSLFLAAPIARTPQRLEWRDRP